MRVSCARVAGERTLTVVHMGQDTQVSDVGRVLLQGGDFLHATGAPGTETGRSFIHRSVAPDSVGSVGSEDPVRHGTSGTRDICCVLTKLADAL